MVLCGSRVILTDNKYPDCQQKTTKMTLIFSCELFGRDKRFSGNGEISIITRVQNKPRVRYTVTILYIFSHINENFAYDLTAEKCNVARGQFSENPACFGLNVSF
uniref:Uncharacterized protein n=1 Tax=Cacopsylla melanoneura TaxID=428564 RepID=A0A8D8RRQ9_9HEMI